MNNVDQADRVHIEDRGGVRIAAHLWRIAGNTNQVSDSDCRCAQQIGLNAQHIAVPAGVMQDGFNSGMLLQQQRKCLVAHARRGARTVGNIDRIHAHRFQELGAIELFFNVRTLRRNDFHHGDELAASDLRTHA